MPVWLNRNSKCCIIGFDQGSYHVCSTCHTQHSMLRLVGHKSSNEIFPCTNCMFHLKNAFNVASWSSTMIDEGTFQHMQRLLWTQKILSFQNEIDTGTEIVAVSNFKLATKSRSSSFAVSSMWRTWRVQTQSCLQWLYISSGSQFPTKRPSP